MGIVKAWLLVGAVNGFLAVAAGAFAAHGLESAVDARALAIFQTAAHYHLTHALAIVGASLASKEVNPSLARAAAALFTAGIVLFCGSLYVLVLTGSNAFVLVTPVGGLLLLAGWIALAASAFVRR